MTQSAYPLDILWGPLNKEGSIQGMGSWWYAPWVTIILLWLEPSHHCCADIAQCINAPEAPLPHPNQQTRNQACSGLCYAARHMPLMSPTPPPPLSPTYWLLLQSSLVHKPAVLLVVAAAAAAAAAAVVVAVAAAMQQEVVGTLPHTPCATGRGLMQHSWQVCVCMCVCVWGGRGAQGVACGASLYQEGGGVGVGGPQRGVVWAVRDGGTRGSAELGFWPMCTAGGRRELGTDRNAVGMGGCL
jgi:hypothetical protein